MSASQRELYIFGRAFDLPSIDPRCLALIAYLSIVGYDNYSIVECSDAALSPTGELPMLHDGKNWIAGINRIITYLSKTGHNADGDLSKELKAKSVSFQALVEETLTDALLFSWFADYDNYVGSIRKAYSTLLSFPARYYVPIQLKKNAVLRVKKYGGKIASGPGGLSLANTENTKIYDMARNCYRVLNRRLKEQAFMFGERPTTLDAKVFGYLALQLYPEIPNPRFKMILASQFPRLVQYCDRCKEVFLQDVPQPSSSSLSAPSSWPWSLSPFAAATTTIDTDTITTTSTSPESSVTASSPGKKLSISEWLKATFSFAASPGNSKDGTEKAAEEKDFNRKRTVAIGFGLLAMIAYMVANGIVVVALNIDTGEEEEELEQSGHFERNAPVFEEIHMPSEDYED
ncbi:metaxin 1 [Mortierella polycephala]|uniref:Metaxin 1 n=1 Tax=Mortierella polycephala TaxID=41804 RepID=A0A9P6Q9U5_9FUNG|nr:metaxin 1 [Mortierella polycephala]